MPMVVIAVAEDIPAWRVLAAEVEPLFGPMVGRSEFEEALARMIARGHALCVRADAGPPGSPLLGGLLWSAHPPHYQIAWLAVTASARGQGIGAALIQTALAWVRPPAEITVVTFGPDIPEGEPARLLYQRIGFVAAEAAPDGPEGGSRQVFRRILDAPDG